jgi:hypothetical protein
MCGSRHAGLGARDAASGVTRRTGRTVALQQGFRRHLAKLSDGKIEEARDLHPRPPAGIPQESEEDRYLKGEP